MSWQRAISFASASGVFCVRPVMMPKPPAFDTAAASLAKPTKCMPPWMIGCWMPNSSVILVFTIAPRELYECADCKARPEVMTLLRVTAEEVSMYQGPANNSGHIEPITRRVACQRGQGARANVRLVRDGTEQVTCADCLTV